MYRTLALIERDVRKFMRSPTLILVSMFFPLVQLVVLGYAFGGKIKNLRVGICRSGPWYRDGETTRDVWRHRR